MALPKIGKIFLWLGGIAVLLTGLTVLVVTLMLGRIVKAGVNTFGPQITGTAVELAEADVSLFGGSATLSGLRIGNPSGWGEGDLASLGHIHLDLAPMSLLGETIVIEALDIEAPVFRYEAKSGTSNVSALLAHVERALAGLGDRSAPPAETGETPAEETGEAAPTLISIGHFGLRGGRVTIIVADRIIEATLPDIDMRDLGSPELGLTPAQLTMRLSQRVLTDIATVAAKALVQEQVEKAIGGKLKGIFGGDP